MKKGIIAAAGIIAIFITGFAVVQAFRHDPALRKNPLSRKAPRSIRNELAPAPPVTTAPPEDAKKKAKPSKDEKKNAGSIDDVKIDVPQKKVRAALEHLNSPSRKDGLSGPERIRKRRKELQIPEDELKNLSTESLLEKILETPLWGSALVGVLSDGGLRIIRKNYNGTREFLTRPGRGDLLLKAYGKATKNVAMEFEDLLKEGEFCFSFRMIEILLTADEAVACFDGAEKKKEVLRVILSSLKARQRYNKTVKHRYDAAFEVYAALALAKYLEALGDETYLEWARASERVLTPTKGGESFVDLPKAFEEAKSIVEMAKKSAQ